MKVLKFKQLINQRPFFYLAIFFNSMVHPSFYNSSNC